MDRRGQRRRLVVISVIAATAGAASVLTAYAATGGGSKDASPGGHRPAASAPETVNTGVPQTSPAESRRQASAARKPSKKCGVNSKLVPSCGAFWGMYSVKGRTLTTSITDLEKRFGRRFDIVLRFHDFSNDPPGRFPDASEQELGRSRLLFFAWESKSYKSRTSYKWRDVAAGRYDSSIIVPAARRVRAYGKKVFMSFDPEMDRHMTKGELKGNEAEYVAAARHVHQVFQRAGVRNVVWVWTTTGSLGGDNAQRILKSYPGHAYTDWIGFDPYNFYQCHRAPWTSFEEEVGVPYRWLQRNGLGDKPFILPEFGTQFDSADPERSRQWYKSIPGVMEREFPNLKGLIRFNSGEECDVQLDNGPGMANAYGQAGKAPYLNPPR
ncbi:glycosyl hydrolase [Actinomadura rudentiformis]|uniref:GH26 domain-containing protein n=1 Tax=Actinomadura rudentiformis TaxID=359158 RepID=A0A6H9YLM5_9ACTN|nr:glycosyl hydrolase [Actinomadura rudentiformis]KAB2344036.1 hypothetical protein F8566_32410 [Actinomadura rudentiformis]